MHTSAKLMFVAIIVFLAVIGVLCSGLVHIEPTPPQKRQDTSSYTPLGNVEIDATTFNGDIAVEQSSSDKIEVTYSIQTPQGKIDSVKINNNETKTENTTRLVTTAENVGGDPANAAYIADLVLKLPSGCSYNLTLVTMNGDVSKEVVGDLRVGVTTMNGDIALSADAGCREITATCMNGDIEVSLAQGTEFNVAASVGNGAITYDGVPLQASEDTATRLKAATQNGADALKVALMSGDGNIKLSYV
jgi:DUF4097 and DUF4098 domain-containing protein YvlB